MWRRAKEILRVRSDNKYSALQMRDEAATIAVYKLRRIFDAVRARGGQEKEEPRESREAMICIRKNTLTIPSNQWRNLRKDCINMYELTYEFYDSKFNHQLGRQKWLKF